MELAGGKTNEYNIPEVAGKAFWIGGDVLGKGKFGEIACELMGRSAWEIAKPESRGVATNVPI